MFEREREMFEKERDAGDREMFEIERDAGDREMFEIERQRGEREREIERYSRQRDVRD